MSRAAISDPLWAEMTTAQQAETVLAGRATLRQIVAGLLDGSDQLREACRQFLVQTDASLKDIRLEGEANSGEARIQRLDANSETGNGKQEPIEDNPPDALTGAPRKQRHGLPPGYTPRLPPQ